MEVRKANVMFGKAGGNASRNSYTCRISLPKTWLDRMGLNPERREVQIVFDGDRISIQQPKYGPVKQVPLTSNKRIRTFALVWEQMYRNHANIPFEFFEDTAFVGEGLADLGFLMDCGESIKRAFPGVDVFKDIEVLKRIMNQIDLQTLGNAIFSQWRYWNHWSTGRMEESDFEWFVIAYSRLAELAA